ncbi:hypothetical protein [Natrinema sp. SYSU A 869]|uniref:hypothetical protein n=1 Tax=Natrinema sp. SYSU A 869 TaxID=2871694 RepID=UPI00272ECCD7|nr:hypothetical protein [Natrinema sp. SYSU A 869]
MSEGGNPFDEPNFQTLCEHCHERKTADENTSAAPQSDVMLVGYLESGVAKSSTAVIRTSTVRSANPTRTISRSCSTAKDGQCFATPTV